MVKFPCSCDQSCSCVHDTLQFFRQFFRPTIEQTIAIIKSCLDLYDTHVIPRQWIDTHALHRSLWIAMTYLTYSQAIPRLLIVWRLKGLRFQKLCYWLTLLRLIRVAHGKGWFTYGNMVSNICQCIVWSMVRVMHCGLFSAKPLHTPMLAYCQSGHGTNRNKIWIKTSNSLFKRMHLNIASENVSHFV